MSTRRRVVPRAWFPLFCVTAALCLGLLSLWLYGANRSTLIPHVVFGLVFFFSFISITRLSFVFIVYFVALYSPLELLVYKFVPGVVGDASRFVTEVLLILGIVRALIDSLVLGKPWKRTCLDLPLLLFAGTAALSAIANKVPPHVVLLGVRPLLRYALLYYIVCQAHFTDQQSRRLLIGIFVIAAIVILIGLLQAALGQPVTNALLVRETTFGEQVLRSITNVESAQGRYIFSTLGRYDALGTYCVLIILLAVSCYLYIPAWRLRLSVLIVMLIFCLVLTMSRQSWASLYISFWGWCLLTRKRQFAYLAYMLVLMAFSLILLGYYLPHLVQRYKADQLADISVIQRCLELLSSSYLYTTAHSGGRLYVLRVVGQRILELAPVLGFGPGRFASMTASLLGYNTPELLGMDAGITRLVNDVNWIVVLGQYGIAGTLAFLNILMALLKRAWRQYRRAVTPISRSLALACLGCLIAFILLGFFGPNFEQRVISMYVWLVAGLASVPGQEGVAARTTAPTTT